MDLRNDELISWNGTQISKSELEIFYKKRKMISWYITENCNYKCDYCGVWKNNQQNLMPIDVDKLSKGLNSLNGNWIIYISGGEPFLEKNFIQICKEITKKHLLAFSTNLTSINVYDFADQIDPAKCLFINASVHIIEREKTKNGTNSYIEKMLYLQNKGFNVIAAYVAYPPLIDRIVDDFEYLRYKGLEKVKLKIFMGDYQGKFYPKSLNEYQKAILNSLDADYPELEIINYNFNYNGKLCNAGVNSFAMDRYGRLSRCSSISKNYGNIFEQKIVIDCNPRPCPQNKYLCIHECIENNLMEKGSSIKIVKESLPEKISFIQKWSYQKLLFAKKILLNPSILKKHFIL